MVEWWIDLWNVSALCSVGILVVFAVSPMLRKTHTAFWRYCLWIFLAVRLVLPFDLSIPGRAFVIPVMPAGAIAEQSFSDGIIGAAEPKNRVGAAAGAKANLSSGETDLAAGNWNTGKGQKQETKAGNGKTGDIQAAAEVEEGKTIRAAVQSNPQESAGAQHRAMPWRHIFSWAFVIWAAGAAALLLWQAVCYAVFYRKIERTKRFFAYKDNLPVYISPVVGAPLLMGFRKPQIVLADRKYTREQLGFILGHERMHYQRKDLWVKLLFAAARTIHWFNPFVYWMERQAAQDIELLCDSLVARNFSGEEKKQYGQTLLECAASSRNRYACFGTSAFSRDVKALKERLANVCSANARKRGIPAVAFGILVLLVASLFVACNASNDAAGMPDQKDMAAERMDVPETEKQAQDDVYLKQKYDELTGLRAEDAANAVYGAVFPRLIYASDERAVLYDYWGLLIYDIKNSRIEQLLDLKAADLCHIQGEQVTHIEVSKDGGEILLYNEPDTRERFVYGIDDRRLEYSDLETFGKERYDGLLEREEKTFAKTSSGKTVSLSADSLYTQDGGIFHPDDMQGLSVLVADGAWGGAEIYPLFMEYYAKKGEEAVPHLKIEEMGRILGKEFLHEDEAGWRYYLEEDTEQESVIWEFAAVMRPLLLTRYRDGERQVLDDLLFADAWLECPVLFAGGRILYKAAVTPDIVGIKDASLVSIAMDGSDRRVADTIMYRVFDGLCEDGGWIYYSGWTNGSTQPKPLCRISPDFSSGAQFVEEIPGLLCGVKDGFVYYLASSEKNPGIWKRSLSSGEEQIYDKWGITAEDILFFWARETVFVSGEPKDTENEGCSMIYQTDEGENVSYCVLFDGAN